MYRLILLTLLLSFVLGLTACVSLDQVIQREGEKHGAPQHIIDAVKHGCSSGRAAAGANSQWQKDYNLYQSDNEYKMRWDDSFALCKGKYEDAMRLGRGR